MRVLVSLHPGYGLGDSVQVSVILQHLRKYRPDWSIDYQAEEGRHQVGRGIVDNTFARGAPYPSAHYDEEYEICLYDKWWGYTDRPNTHIIYTLKETFSIDWDSECSRYKVKVDDLTQANVQGFLPEFSPVVALHTEGRTAKANKNLSYEQFARLRCMLDRIGVSTLNMDSITGSPTELCALICQCEAFVGIDSGPAKCASATNTPSLVIWTGHHPVKFHDPAPNTAHLVPDNHYELLPNPLDERIIQWFPNHYRFRTYDGDPVSEVQRWLEEVLE